MPDGHVLAVSGPFTDKRLAAAAIEEVRECAGTGLIRDVVPPPDLSLLRQHTPGTPFGAGSTGSVRLGSHRPPRTPPPGTRSLTNCPTRKSSRRCCYPVVPPPPLAELTLPMPPVNPELKVATEKNW
nr:hypothetical protein [Pseudarthrobacter sp. fls2-241-R2A-127]